MFGSLFKETPIYFIADNIDRIKFTARTLSRYKKYFDKVNIEHRFIPETNRHHVYKKIQPSVSTSIIVAIPAELYEQSEYGFLLFEEYLKEYGNDV